ncbi:hypothetical protein BT96DRAFT_1006508 [Gymnopus androsaceus JB14]|uniref:Uncharacterized protein n=1 Tax=Gymnopus androsaceus JB14 TaxID=1447944 RepID=A0A6A4GKQ6_9AGAR|nr:hypothetical protein BT96DRAFT_1006508 [Gymnopus androsaceus JB14]
MSSDMLNDDWEHVIQCCLSEFVQQVHDEKQGVDPAVKKELQDPDDYLDKKLVESSDAFSLTLLLLLQSMHRRFLLDVVAELLRKSICPTRTTQSATAGAALGAVYTSDDEDEESIL